MTNDYARAEGGKRIKCPKPGSHGTKFSLISAISIFGIISIMYSNFAINTESFLAFIKNDLINKLKKGQVVFMDNVAFHKSPIIKKLIESKGAMLVFLPPYSPDLSPIEKMWSKLKHYIKKFKPRNNAEFHDSLISAISKLNDEDFVEWYESCGYSLC